MLKPAVLIAMFEISTVFAVEAHAQVTGRWSDNYVVPAAPAAARAAPPQNGSLCAPGKAVNVLYVGTWYPARVLEDLDSMNTCLVSYDGFGSNWDERVSLKRMRPANADSAPVAQSNTRQTATQAVPTGKYSCYTFDNGQLNYTYTDVEIETGNRYSVGGKGGSYTLSSGGAMAFTGTMANATGKFSVKNSGKPNIDLVFNGDNRASMSCAKSR